MKKILAILLTLGIINNADIVYAQEMKLSIASNSLDELSDYAFENSIVNGTIRIFKSFEVSGREIRLFPETIVSAQEAIDTYPDGYAYIVGEAEKMGINVDMDNVQFQEFVKTFALFESCNSLLTEECNSLAIYMDYYENAAINAEILSAASKRTLVADELELLMPITSNSKTTMATGEDISVQDKKNTTKSSAYDATAAISYAYSWWNKTNNIDYSYYAEYYGVDTSRNDYNDLDIDCDGQSDVRRAWSDCTNFVSQCLVAGGVPQIKSGLILPHQKISNWYYSDTKPSHTWGGASNFYNHWKNRVGVAESTSLLGLGDVISIDFAGDGSPDHTVIIVSEGNTDSTKLLAAHSTDRYNNYYSDGMEYNFSVEYLYTHEEWSIYGFVIDSAF